MSKKENPSCAICGSTKDITQEHVPPKALFLKPRPSNTITVPACRRCNQGTAIDDEYFRAFISAWAIPENKQLMRLWKEKVVQSSFSRSPGLVRRINEDTRDVLNHHKMDPLLTLNGTPLPDKYLDKIVSFDTDRINRVCEKIARCLFFHHFKKMLPEGSEIEIFIEHKDSVKYEVILNRSGMVGGVDGEFIYAYKLLPGCIEWFLLFYLQILMVVKVSLSNSGHEGQIPSPN